MRFVLAVSVGLALLLSACSKSAPSNAPIQAAIEQHLRNQPNVVFNNMTMEVQSVKIDGDHAQAEVKFRSKQSPDLAVGVHYTLQRSGDTWKVVSSSSAGMGGNPHGGAGGPMPEPAPSQPQPQPSH
jgi:hypothetical protein